MLENGNIMSILEEYELALGQRINKANNSTSFNKNVWESAKSIIKAFWRAKKVTKLAKYLGLPQMVG